ncbi:YkgJ family cysteine cluster protein [Thermodesulfobacteriota bacterium]
MKLTPFLNNYELLVDKAELAFHRMEKEHGSCIRCELHCSDCCNAVFGLFLIEALYIREHFDQIDDEQKRQAVLWGKTADRELEALQEKLKTFENDPHMQTYTLARERIRCPLLDEQDECILYHRRPVTCRVYGIPTKIQGKVRVCGKAGFKEGETYPVFGLDAVYSDLFVLSKEILEKAGIGNADKASLLISMSKVIRTSSDDLINEDFN